MLGGDRVIVGVCRDPSCKDAIKWAVANKISSPNDTLVFLHVVTKIPSAMGVEMFQSEVNNTTFVHHVRTVVQPMMLALKKHVDPSVTLELKVGRNNSREKGIVEESAKLKATVLVIGTNSRGMFNIRGRTSSMGAYCVRNKPKGASVFVIQRDKVVLSRESDGSSPGSESPRIGGGGSGTHTPTDRSARGPGGVQSGSESSQGSSDSLALKRSISGSSEHSDSSMHGAYYAAQAQGGGGEYYAAHHAMAVSRQPSYGYPSYGGDSGGNDMQHHMATSPWQHQLQQQQQQQHQYGGGSSGGYDTYQTLLQQQQMLQQQQQQQYQLQQHMQHQGSQAQMRLPTEIAADFETWKKAHGAAAAGGAPLATFQQQQDYMRDLEMRMARARATLANLPDVSSPAGSAVMAATGVAGQGRLAGVGSQSGKEREGSHVMERQSSGVDGEGSGGNSRASGVSALEDGDLRRELEELRRKAAEAEQARLDAEQRAQKALQGAEAQRKQVIKAGSQDGGPGSDSGDAAPPAAEGQGEGAGGAAEGGRKAKAAKEEKKPAAKPVVPTVSRMYRIYTWEEVMNATENLKPSRKLGEGGFGTVFSGTLHHTPVAVKILKNADSLQAATEFQQEVDVLGQIQHPHMVMLLGCCPDKYCLVYEHMANGSLEDRLNCLNDTPPLPWYTRVRIAAEISSALLVLHTRPIPIVHRDLKPGNILLDKNFVAKLGDVGLAKLMPELSANQTYMRESVPVGTFAYVDPEFQRTGEFGPKSDVYALGIVLLDLLTGRKPNVYEGLEEAVDSGEEERLTEFLDPKSGDWPLDIAMDMARMGVKCSEMKRKKRPDLAKQVMPILDKAREKALAAEDEAARPQPRMVKSKDTPNWLLCPITQKIMEEPVLASDGHTYEYSAIQQWLETSDKSPMTNSKLPNKDVVPNHAVRSMIKDWMDMHS